MKTNKNYFFVGTALQVINAVEYVEKITSKSSNILIVYNTKSTVRKEVEAAINNYKWNRIIYLGSTSVLSIKNQTIKFVLNNLFAFIKLQFISFKKASLIGNDINYFFRYTVKKNQNNKIVYIDDGTATINYKEDNPYKTFKDKKNRLLYQFLGIKTFIIKPTIFFTNYKEILKTKTKSKIIENDYSYLKEVIKNQKESTIIYFIGDPHVERGYLTKETYLNKLRQVKNTFEEKVVYIARLYEDKNKLNEISKIITVLENDVPFEMYMVNQKIKPKILIGYHSSVFFNAHKMFGESLEYYFIKLPNFTNKIHYANVEKLWEKLAVFAKQFK